MPKDLTVSLVLHCCECGEGVDVPEAELAIQKLPAFLFKQNWVMSVITPPGEPRVRMALLCNPCSRKVFPGAMLEEARRAIQNLINKRN